MAADWYDLDVANGVMIVGRPADCVEIDVSSIYPRFIVHGTGINVIRMPRGGCEISITEWRTRTGGDPNEFKKLLESGQVDDITFNMNYSDITMVIKPAVVHRRAWEHGGAHESPFDGIVRGVDREMYGRWGIQREERPPALPSHKTREEPLDYIWRALQEGAALCEDDLDARERAAAEQLFEWGLACKTAPRGDGLYRSFEISSPIRQWIEDEELRERAARYRPASTSIAFEAHSSTTPSRLIGHKIDLIAMDESMEDELSRSKTTVTCSSCAGRGLIRNVYNDDLAECGPCRGSGFQRHGPRLAAVGGSGLAGREPQAGGDDHRGHRSDGGQDQAGALDGEGRSRGSAHEAGTQSKTVTRRSAPATLKHAQHDDRQPLLAVRGWTVAGSSSAPRMSTIEVGTSAGFLCQEGLMSRGDFKVFYNGDHCSVRVMDDVATNWAIAEAMKINDEVWFINRVLVRDAARRGNGLGGQALDTLLTKLRAEGVKSIIVTPGGYVDDEARQIKFYVKHGFTEVPSGLFRGAYCRVLNAPAEDVDEDFGGEGLYILVPVGVSEGDYVCHHGDRWKWTAETVTMPKVVEIKGERLYTEAGSVAELIIPEDADRVGDRIRAVKPDVPGPPPQFIADMRAPDFTGVVPETDEDRLKR